MFYTVTAEIDPHQPEARYKKMPPNYVEAGGMWWNLDDPDQYNDYMKFRRDNGWGKWNANRQQSTTLVNSPEENGAAERVDNYFLYGDR